MAALAGEQDLHAGLRGQRFERTRQARRLAAKARQLDEALDIDRDHCAVLAVLAAGGRAFEHLGEQRIADDEARHALDQQRKPRALRAAERERQPRHPRIRGGFSLRIQRNVGRQCFAAAPRLCKLAERHHSRSHIERDRAVFARHGESERGGGDAGRARSVVGHVRPRGGKGDRRHAEVRNALGVVAQRGGVGGHAHEAHADAGAARFFHRERRGVAHRNRARCTVGIEQHARRRVAAGAHRRPRVQLAASHPFHVARHAHHPMGVDAAQIGPDQRARDRLGVLVGHSGFPEDPRNPRL